ncbi:MAG TPA: TIGR01777 family oxidoreductase [Longimicrobiaceae bacterium]|nr:TIGR01777 family oxidoreductase [Longimicrobiaceae bacterium]
MSASEPEAGASPPRVAVTGSTGLIGTALVPALPADGYRVVRLVRSRPEPGGGEVAWDPAAGTIDTAGLEGVDAVIHLAGENVGRRWTAERRRRIRDSRARGTRLLAEALAGLARPPRVLVSASAIGYYGDRGDELLDEGTASGAGFLAEVVREWEASADPARERGIRVVHPRFGVVLTPQGGALQRILPPFRLGVGGRVGSGRQWMSWLTLDDVVEAVRFLLRTEGLSGPVNVAAPHPVTNEEFTRTLGRVLGRPTLFPVPAAALRLALGQMAEETVLASQRVVPRKLLDAGFAFRHPELEGALRAVLGR